MLISLGKPLRRPDGSVSCFHIASGPPRNPARPLLNDAIWKFFADHYGHPIRVLDDHDDADGELDGYAWIGEDDMDSTSFEDYLRGWEGLRVGTELTVEQLEAPPTRIAPAVDAAEQQDVAVHVAFPPRMLNRWSVEFETGKLRVVSARGMRNSDGLLRLIDDHLLLSEYHGFGQVRAERVVLRDFGRLWASNRPSAVEILRVLPCSLAHARDEQRSLHYALMDLNPSIVDAVLAELRSAPAEGMTTPIAVFDHRSSQAPAGDARFDWHPRRWPEDPAVAEALKKWLGGGGEDLFYALVADLSGSDFTGGQLDHAWFLYSDLSGAVLRDASLREAECTEARFVQCDLTDTDATGANFDQADFTRARLAWADLTAASADDAKFRDASLAGALLTNTSLVRADLTNADLRDCRFDMTRLTGASLHTARVSGATGSVIGPAIVRDDDRTALLDGPDLADWFRRRGARVRAVSAEAPAAAPENLISPALRRKRKQNSVVKIRMMIDWNMDPFWIRERCDSVSYPVSAADLREYCDIPDDLVAGIDRWHAEWVALLDWGCPPDTEFPSPEAEADWSRRGREFAERVAALLPRHIRFEHSGEVLCSGLPGLEDAVSERFRLAHGFG
ncbi:pentapeptide repeat-containing protein [Saccharopolyspora sp. NPDC000359]|uniref:pentapeptide repeat-containing protein n=1 Tax=Saccharopolyspora sp. NPDC000359 TaxID=3154251 RepID=UPI003329B967